MPIVAEKPDTVFTQMALDLYNTTRSSDLPAKGAGPYGIDNAVWGNLITLTRAKCQQLGVNVPPGTAMTGLCIWASVVATKFFVMRNSALTSRTVRVRKTAAGKGSDHYFVVAKDGANVVICDVTCNQFGAPDYIVGRLNDIKGTAKRFTAFDGTLYEAYSVGAAGAAAGTFVV
ncbi:hypothetical protein [Pararhodobacter sp. SW119]|uniref:hypothetical protein n=1 Tax=Pararhodobacter sp. SW119 TaxID=2780075 RepID=UPI001ADF00D5|nr:hypothetical protein [Pararhodobacter sp. SW119]